MPWTDDFVDIEGDAKPAPFFRTRVKMAWDTQYLYILAEMEEPHVWGTLTQHDSVIFYDNDFEVFLDPDGDRCCYVELEINALNTTWDLLLVRSYRNGGPALDGFELHGLRTAVKVDGTVNDPSDLDRGWTAEIAIPFQSLRQIARCPSPPKDGDLWRINFSRVQWDIDIAHGEYRKIPDRREHNWVWSPQGVVDMHRPEMWGILQFTEGLGTPAPIPLPGAEARQILMSIHEQMLEVLHRKNRFAPIPVPSGVELQVIDGWYVARTQGYQIDAGGELRKS